MSANDAVILSQVTYAYKPLVFDDFMKRNYASSGGTYTLGENIYQKPPASGAAVQRHGLPAAHVPLSHRRARRVSPLAPFAVDGSHRVRVLCPRPAQ